MPQSWNFVLQWEEFMLPFSYHECCNASWENSVRILMTSRKSSVPIYTFVYLLSSYLEWHPFCGCIKGHATWMVQGNDEHRNISSRETILRMYDATNTILFILSMNNKVVLLTYSLEIPGVDPQFEYHSKESTECISGWHRWCWKEWSISWYRIRFCCKSILKKFYKDG